MPRFSAVEQLFSMGTAILIAKQVALKSKNFQWLVFVKGKLDCLTWRRVVQDDFDDMATKFSK